MTELRGTRALVTGGTSGLGLAMARALVDAGARVAITSRYAERAAHAASGLGPGALGLALDVRDERAVAAGVLEVWDGLGGIDLLVNNAGIGMRTVNPRFLSDPQPFWDVSPDGFRDVLETKATGCFLMARASRLNRAGVDTRATRLRCLRAVCRVDQQRCPAHQSGGNGKRARGS